MRDRGREGWPWNTDSIAATELWVVRQVENRVVSRSENGVGPGRVRPDPVGDS